MIVDDDGVEADMKAKFEALRKANYSAALQSMMHEEDFSDDGEA